MRKRTLGAVLFCIILLGIAAAVFVFPNEVNRGIDFFNAKRDQISKLQWLPHIRQVPNVPFRFGLDLRGGAQLTYQADLSNVQKSEYDAKMQGLRDIIERRVNFFGVVEPNIQIEGSGDDQRLVVDLPGVTNAEQANKLVTSAPFLEFKERLSVDQTKEILKEFLGDQSDQADPETLCRTSIFLRSFIAAYRTDPCFQSVGLTGAQLKRADVDFQQLPSQPAVSLQFNEEGAKIFEEITGRNIQKPVAIYLDGQPVQIATVQEKISGGQAQITGIASLDEARQLVRNLNAGAIPVSITLISQRTLGPTLGALSLQQSLRAGIGGLAAVLGFMILFYRLPGLLASIALMLYVLFLLASFKIFSVTLSLAGIAGVILSIGMAVDANILVFARMREEMREGKGFSAALSEGFRRAWPSIRDGNLTTILTTVILFLLGSSFVQGFAVTLLLGILLSMFSALVVTRILLRMFEGTRLSNLKRLWI
ncbi:MAG: protein translocase subunit SecD [Candidatus Wildermuthbacteria bacterium]|nr:protein translocase subunit SecD [Candidatus Wildermuthbacteria bacterium]